MSEPVFAPEILHYLDKAGQWCRSRKLRLTETRRQVLGLILSEEKPVGAYELLAKLRVFFPNAVPPTIYRALDFLLENGLIHRIESLSAFVGCCHNLHCREVQEEKRNPEEQPERRKEAQICRHEVWGGHRAQFLICRQCHHVQELEQDIVAAVLLNSARSHGFRAEKATVEIEGLCASCAALLS